MNYHTEIFLTGHKHQHSWSLKQEGNSTASSNMFHVGMLKNWESASRGNYWFAALSRQLPRGISSFVNCLAIVCSLCCSMSLFSLVGEMSALFLLRRNRSTKLEIRNKSQTLKASTESECLCGRKSNELTMPKRLLCCALGSSAHVQVRHVVGSVLHSDSFGIFRVLHCLSHQLVFVLLLFSTVLSISLAVPVLLRVWQIHYVSHSIVGSWQLRPVAFAISTNGCGLYRDPPLHLVSNDRPQPFYLLCQHNFNQAGMAAW